MSTSKSLGQYLKPALDERRKTAQFERIAERLERPRSAWPRIAWPAVAVVLAAVVFVVGRTSAPVGGAPSDVAVLEGDAMTLLDGSRVVLDPAGRLRLATLTPEAIRLVLEQGTVDVSASHVAGRSFVVAAAGYEVHVVGTRFRVSRSGASGVAVTVSDGSVEIRREGQAGVVQALGAGQTWSVALEPAAKVEPPRPLPEPVVALEPEAAESAAPPVAKSGAPTAKQLFERAQAARAQGKLDEAAALLRTLRRLHPSDPRASLAAFELARIQLDTRGDPKEADQALKEAIESAPAGAPHLEDAEARRVQALEAAGDHAGCVAAKNAYLARYPKGVHRAQVSARCKKR
jgi:tetratricopeptide (TPR) repeat protein